jgi:hypothetical protein
MQDGFERIIDAFLNALQAKEQRLHDDAQALADERRSQQATGAHEQTT